MRPSSRLQPGARRRLADLVSRNDDQGVAQASFPDAGRSGNLDLSGSDSRFPECA